MNKYQKVKNFLKEVDAHPEWVRIELSQPFIEEVRELVDKATPKVTIVEPPKTKYYGSCLSKNLVFNVCPVCGNLLGDVKCLYCNRCGQALDWSEEHETD